MCKKSSTFAAGMIKNHIIVWVLAVVLSACGAPKTPEEALRTVAEADSLWLSGWSYTDSLSLAHAYEELGEQRTRYPDEFAHACYHYGRLLRTQDDPVSAMQAFINATRSPSTDFHILGRIYSNIGDMCHRAEEFQLSYDMFEKSADMYLRNGDTLFYYYGLNNMAFELAEQGKKEETLALLDEIETNANSRDLISVLLETKAELYLKCKQYDSTIIYAHCALSGENPPLVSYIQIAQAFSYLGERDSATYYANIVLAKTDEPYFVNNALYILTNDDATKDADAIRETAADRADAQKIIESKRARLAQALQWMELDLNRVPKKKPVYPIVIVACALSVVVIMVVRNRKRKHQMQNQILSIHNKHAEEIVASIKKHIDVNDLNNTLHWKNYEAMRSDADLYMGGMVSKLEAHSLNETEIRFCILTVLDFPLKQIADTIHYSYPSGIKTLKKRTSDKLKTTPTELKSYLLHKL